MKLRLEENMDDLIRMDWEPASVSVRFCSFLVVLKSRGAMLATFPVCGINLVSENVFGVGDGDGDI